MIPVIAELYIFVYDKNTGYYKVVSTDETTVSIPTITQSHNITMIWHINAK